MDVKVDYKPTGWFYYFEDISGYKTIVEGFESHIDAESHIQKNVVNPEVKYV